MKRWLFRISMGVIVALPLMLVSVALAQSDQGGGAGTAPAATTEPQEPECLSCHASFHAAWANGSHGPVISEVFQTEWQAQGSPQACLSCHVTDGVSCQTCHDPVSAGHPLAPASTNRSVERCESCHAQTDLGWQVSAHAQTGLTCVSCHDSHAVGQQMKGDVSVMCANCHSSTDDNFAHAAHLPVGLTCAECHLRQPGDPLPAPHTVRDHSFDVKVTTCDSCHTSRAQTMALNVPPAEPPEGPLAQLTPSSADTAAPTMPAPTSAEVRSVAQRVNFSPIPEPVSPLGFSVLSILIGFGVGIVVAPWMERWYRQRRQAQAP